MRINPNIKKVERKIITDQMIVSGSKFAAFLLAFATVFGFFIKLLFF